MTVNNFVSTSDNTEQMASAPSDATIVNQIESKFCGVELNRIKVGFSQIAQL